MKKKLFLLMFISIFSFFIYANSVNAYSCEYYDESGKLSFTISVDTNGNVFRLYYDNEHGNLFSRYDRNDTTNIDKVTSLNTLSFDDCHGNNCRPSLRVYVQLFASESDMKKLINKTPEYCPKQVMYSKCNGADDDVITTTGTFFGNSGGKCKKPTNTFYFSDPNGSTQEIYTCEEYDLLIDEIKELVNNSDCHNQLVVEKADILREKCEALTKNGIASSEGKTPCYTKCAKLSDEIDTICKTNAAEVSRKCGLGTKMIGWITKIFKWMRYIAPALLIILGITDFIKAIAADSEDELKKAEKRFVKRLIAAAIFFLIPTLLQFVFDVFTLPGLDSANPFCMD